MIVTLQETSVEAAETATEKKREKSVGIYTKPKLTNNEKKVQDTHIKAKKNTEMATTR